MNSPRRYHVGIEFEAEPQTAAQLRRLLPHVLTEAGCKPTTGTTIVEAWMRRAMFEVPKHHDPIMLPDHGVGVVNGKLPRRR